jgi:hypothetical protein
MGTVVGRSRRLVSLLGASAAAVAGLVLGAGCGQERDMPEHAEMPDSMPVVRAMHEPGARDSMLDTIPGGEMARGDSAAAMRLLKTKM